MSAGKNPANDLGIEFLDAARSEFRRYKRLGDEALAQAADEDLNWRPDPESNSIALVVRHIAGNLKSRWTDFLTTDGEKPWRDRDGEFEGSECSREELQKRWAEGWACLFGALEDLTPGDLLKTVTIRGQPQSATLALQRALAHVAYHVGQIVHLAKSRRGKAFKSLSIPKGHSKGSKAK